MESVHVIKTIIRTYRIRINNDSSFPVVVVKFSPQAEKLKKVLRLGKKKGYL